MPVDKTRVRQDEVTVWLQKDRHSEAFNVLGKPWAQRMARLVGEDDAQKSKRCLDCHALNIPEAKRGRTIRIEEGVSCEACHGPASAWLGPHTTQGWTHEQSLGVGMYDTKDPVVRTELCLTCHLGTADKFVDHELIAAGHPVLSFELERFSESLPRHWREPGLTQDPWMRVRDWAVGQAVHLAGSLRLLEVRAGNGHWPEYAESQCESCHHGLTPPEKSWRLERGYPDRQAGAPPWNASRYDALRHLAEQLTPSIHSRLETGMSELTELLNQLHADRQAVAAKAASVASMADELARDVAKRTFNASTTLGILTGITGDGPRIADGGAQSAWQAIASVDRLFDSYSRNVQIPKRREASALIDQMRKMVGNAPAYSAYDAREFRRGMQRLNRLLSDRSRQ